jgi:hypothetical protein
MKPNAHLYLPKSVIERWLGSTGSHLPKLQDRPQGPPVVAAEQLDGGCVLYRLARPEESGIMRSFCERR